MKKTRQTIRQAHEASRCRRNSQRTQLAPTSITCWDVGQQPTPVRSIELDSKGGRLLLPWDVAEGQYILVSMANHLNQHLTIRARVAWTQSVKYSSSVIAGLAFDEEVSIAA